MYCIVVLSLGQCCDLDKSKSKHISLLFGVQKPSVALRIVSLVFLIPRLVETTIPASSWIQPRASCSKGQLCGLRCFDMQATPGPLGCDPLFCQQLISAAMIAVTERSVIGAQARGVFVKELRARPLSGCVRGNTWYVSYVRSYSHRVWMRSHRCFCEDPFMLKCKDTLGRVYLFAAAAYLLFY